MKINKLLTVFIIAVSALCIILTVRIFNAGDEAIINGTSDVQDGLISPFLYLGYLTMALILAFVFYFVLKNLFTHKETLKSTALYGGLFLLLIIISFVLSTGKEVLDKSGTLILSEYGDKWVGAGIILFYFLGALAIGSMFFFGFKKMFKN